MKQHGDKTGKVRTERIYIAALKFFIMHSTTGMYVREDLPAASDSSSRQRAPCIPEHQSDFHHGPSFVRHPVNVLRSVSTQKHTIFSDTAQAKRVLPTSPNRLIRPDFLDEEQLLPKCYSRHKVGVHCSKVYHPDRTDAPPLVPSRNPRNIAPEGLFEDFPEMMDTFMVAPGSPEIFDSSTLTKLQQKGHDSPDIIPANTVLSSPKFHQQTAVYDFEEKEKHGGRNWSTQRDKQEGPYDLPFTIDIENEFSSIQEIEFTKQPKV
jgi:hypothetical protein